MTMEGRAAERSEAETLARALGGLCDGHEAVVIAMALSTLLADGLLSLVVTDGMSAAGTRRLTRRLQEMAARLRRLDGED
jgi:hypothetical protein